MNYAELISTTFQQLGIDLFAEYNCFQPPYNSQSGWPLRLPDVEFGPHTLVLLHFQDFVTPGLAEIAQVEAHYHHYANQVLS